MKEKTALFQSLERMSSREKTLLFSMLAVLVVGGLVIAGAKIQVSLARLEKRNAYQSRVLRKIRSRSHTYAAYRERELNEQQLIKQNRVRHIDQEVKRILRDNKLDQEEWRPKKRERLVKVRRKKKKKQRKTFLQRVERLEQALVLRRVKYKTLFQLLDAIQKSPKLLFIREIDITRDFNYDDLAKTVTITVATFQVSE